MLNRSLLQSLVERAEHDLDAFHRGALRVSRSFNDQPTWEDVTSEWIQRTEQGRRLLRDVLAHLPEIQDRPDRTRP